MREFDFKKELQACKDKKREDETIVFTVGSGRIIPLPTDRRKPVGWLGYSDIVTCEKIYDIAEQLKAGGENEQSI